MNLYKKNGIVSAITILKEGDSITVQDPMFQDYKGIIIYIDHRKQRAKVQSQFNDKEWMTWIACNVLYHDDHFPNSNESRILMK